MALWIKNGTVVDLEKRELRVACDVLCDHGKIIAMGDAVATIATDQDEVVDASGLWVCPGLIDMHVSIPALGHPEAETLADGIAAAKAGGFTGVVCMPDTDPVIDYGSLVEYILLKSEQQGFPVYPVGALTVSQNGESLSDMGDLKRCGAVGFADTGKPLMNSEVMRRAMEYAKMFERSVMVQCEDTDLSSEGVMHEGYRSTVLGFEGHSSSG